MYVFMAGQAPQAIADRSLAALDVRAGRADGAAARLPARTGHSGVLLL